MLYCIAGTGEMLYCIAGTGEMLYCIVGYRLDDIPYKITTDL